MDEMMFAGTVRLRVDGKIAYVGLEDTEGKNTFTKAFMKGITEAFQTIDTLDVNVVVVHGYDNYFCCGGTKEELLGLYEGINKNVGTNFTEGHIYDLFLRCKVPVIAAMQGHAVGGGLALGCFADILIMSEQCIYTASFMKYGFTPGMGATYIIPYKMGKTLGAEMLYSAKTYFGADLKERGVNAIVVKKDEVMETARALAEDISIKPRGSLVLLKDNLVEEIRRELPKAIEKEVQMHNVTFKQTEVLDNIYGLYKQ